MPTTRSRGLSTADLDTLRTQVEAGRKPKVQFTSAAGQVAGQIGQVVRFGRDELPFAPGDLQLPPKAAPRSKVAPKAKASAAPLAASESGASDAVRVSAPPVAAATAATIRPVTAATPSSPAEAAKAAAPAPAAAAAKPAAPAAAAPAAAAASVAKPKPARKAGAKKAPDLTVTLGHHDGQWTISASRGARVLIKPSPVRAADALRMVSQLDSPGVTEAVDDIVAAARAEAEEQAERLRRELAEVEAALADLTDE